MKVNGDNYTFSFKGIKESVLEAKKDIMELLNRISQDKKLIFRLELILEETLLNIAEYGYSEIKGDIKIVIYDEKDQIKIITKDNAPPFNPLNKGAPDTSSDIEKREIGGLGIHFMKEFSDSVQYKRENNQNILKLTFNKRDKNA